MTIEISNDETSNGEEDDPECPVIKYTKEDNEEMQKPWHRTLIIKVMGRRVEYTYLHAEPYKNSMETKKSYGTDSNHR